MFLKSENTKNTEQPEKKKVATYILIAVSIVLIIIAICLITAKEFRYCIQNIDYYASQYEYAIYMSRGYFGSHYRYIASEWKNLFNEALTTIVWHILGAILLSVAGSIGLYKGIGHLKRLKSLSDENEVK